MLDREEIRSNYWNSNDPTVTVIMPTYCRADAGLKKSIESVLNQTYKDFEFIIIDDGSRDSTFSILQEYQQLDPRIVIIRHQLNSGLPALRVNEGILLSKGKYIAYQFDDDELLPNGLEILVNEISKYSSPCLVYGSCELSIKKQNDENSSTILGREFNHGLLINGNFIANNSVLHHKSIFDVVGLYDPHVMIRRFSDYDLWIRMSKKFPFIWVPEIVSRVNAGEENSLGSDIEFKLKNIRKYLEIDRNHLLKQKRIVNYMVDDMEKYANTYNQEEIDEIVRSEILPYRSKVPYYLSLNDLHVANITRRKKRNIAVLKTHYSTSIDVTIRNFTQRIKNMPLNYYFVKESDVSLLDPSDYDLLVLYRTVSGLTTKYVSRADVANKPIAYFMDDNMLKFHELGEAYAYLKPNSHDYINLEKHLSKSDTIISYNEVISKDCRKYNNKIIELSTNIPSQYIHQNKSAELLNSKIKLAIISGKVREKEIKMLWPVLEDLSKKYSEKIELHFWGMNPDDFGSLYCAKFFRPFDHSYDRYLDELSKTFFHFHICPLEGQFDAQISKSPIKFLEGVVSGAVGIFSNILPYSNIPDNLCIKTNNSVEGWKEALEFAINLAEKERKQIYDNARDFILNVYTTESQAHKFLLAVESTELHSRLSNSKVAYFFHESFLGGATLHLLRHALFLKGLGFEIILCLPNYQKPIQDLNELAIRYGLEIVYLEYDRFVEFKVPREKDLIDSIELAKWLERNNVGLAHSVTNVPAVGLACKTKGIPHVATLHQFYPDSLQTSVSLVDFIHSSSNLYARKWSKRHGVPARRIVCPVDKQFFDMFESNSKNLTIPTVRILVSGTLQERKNQHAAIQAISILRDKGYNVHLDVIGYSTLKEDYYLKCLNLIEENNITDIVSLHGFINNPEKFYDNHCNILLCCSLDESMPQTILQAMAAGVLVATVDVGGVKEILKDNYSGLVFKDNDSHSIAKVLEKAINLSKERKSEIIYNAHKTVSMIAKEEFVCSELLNVYNEAFTNKSVLVNTVDQPQQKETNKSFELGLPCYFDTYEGVICGGPSLKKTREFTVKLNASGFSGVRIMVGTHQMLCEGRIVLRVAFANQPEIIIRLGYSANQIFEDNTYVDIYFDPILDSKDKDILLKLSYEPKDEGGGYPSIYEYALKETLLQKFRYRFGCKKSYSLYGFILFRE